jgi:hypothetical protein
MDQLKNALSTASALSTVARETCCARFSFTASICAGPMRATSVVAPSSCSHSASAGASYVRYLPRGVTMKTPTFGGLHGVAHIADHSQSV